MIANFDKAVHRKPSYHAQTLVGYLPTMTMADTDLNARLGRFLLLWT
jgi:hypothetical protein